MALLTPQDIERAVDAQAAVLGLKIAAEFRPGVLMYYELAASMAELVEGLAMTPHDESGSVFVPVSPVGDA